ncbi:hypothetical protein EV421DRAFT_1933778 [Armillaria borealis]|uniref:SWIM-type domain-containing protein n=1 Tax=Armillaria borealis TaxID=47425 RepID=A0AA39IU75_9AGAR|nr:hypothetical protein EV421DRAFT_1933778 [Armillaria borealis]
MSQRHRKAKNKHLENFHFVLVPPAVTAHGHIKVSDRPKPSLTARQLAADIWGSINQLKLTNEQKIQYRTITEQGKIEEHIFSVCGDAEEVLESQSAAASLMGVHGLDLRSREAPENRWNTRHSRKITSETVKAIYQCDCAYDHISAGSKKRLTPAPYTGCLAFAEITYSIDTERIIRIRGYFDHNAACREALLTCIPPFPIHPDVFKLALAQMAGSVSLNEIQKKNRLMIRSLGYPGMQENPHEWRWRYMLEKGDYRSLYRQFSRMQGIRTANQPHVNIHAWLDPTSSHYNAVLGAAVFHYLPRASKGERLEVCIATADMKAAAWRYGHKSQILMDGTFGLCDRKLLLFILMGIDEDHHGVPLAFLFFSAPSGNKHTAAGYDTSILIRLIRKWKESLESFQRTPEEFAPLVATTDTDLKERAALVEIFPFIILLICRVHLRRSWKNHRAKVLKGKASGLEEMRKRMKALEDRIVQTLTLEAAEALILEETQAVQRRINIAILFLCLSSSSALHEPNPTVYTIVISFNHTASCTCADFAFRGGACKHMRAALVYLDRVRRLGHPIPPTPLPDSEAAARCHIYQLSLNNPAPELPTTRSGHILEALLGDGEGIAILDRKKIIDTTGEEEDEELESDESSESEWNESDDDDLDTLRSISKSGVSEQAASRVFHAVGVSVSKLVQQMEYLSMVPMTPETITLASAAHTDLVKVTQQLADRICEGSRTTMAKLNAKRPSTPCSHGSEVLSTANIIASSPEKRQKRKDSYATD